MPETGDARESDRVMTEIQQSCAIDGHLQIWAPVKWLAVNLAEFRMGANSDRPQSQAKGKAACPKYFDRRWNPKRFQ
jgi:hypothetical protein